MCSRMSTELAVTAEEHLRAADPVLGAVIDAVVRTRLRSLRSTLGLTLDELRIDDGAAIVDGAQRAEPYGSGLPVHLDHRDVRAEGKRLR